MADEHNKWLNRETAERLLRGESLEAVDAFARDQAERLAEALGSLSAGTAAATGELPGEQAALAAFREARKDREAVGAEHVGADLGAATASRRPGLPAPEDDAGLVRIGAPPRTGIRSRRPRWARPVRLTLAAALAAGTLGGVAVAAGSGVLPTPFHHARPAPGASVSADETSGQPSVPPPSPDLGSATATPGGGPDGSSRGASSDESPGGHKGKGKGAQPGSGVASGNPRTWWKKSATACRALREGKEPGVGRKRVLEDRAGGSAHVQTYCEAVLAAAENASSGGANGGGDKGGSGDDKGDAGGRGGDDDVHEGRYRGHDGKHRRVGPGAPSPVAKAVAPAHPERAAGSPAPAPSPS
ncbi:hypothetical protein [Streptomyces sp. NPDC002520]